jgi:hypothetical protein
MSNLVPVITDGMTVIAKILDHNRLLVKDMERMLMKLLTYPLEESDRQKILNLINYSDEIRKEHNDLIHSTISKISGLVMGE